MHEIQKVERTVIGRNHPNWQACHRLCGQARRLGNCAAYTLRQRVFNKEPAPTRKELDQELKEHYKEDYRAMPSAASAQRQGQVVAKQFKSYAKAMAEYSKHPEKFSGKPRLPGYKKRYRTFYVGRNGYQIKDGMLSITGGEQQGFQPLPVSCVENQVFNAKAEDAVAGDLRIVAMGNSFVVELTYRVIEEEQKEPTVELNADEALLVDLGIDNFATCVSTKPGVSPILVKGGVLKSLNQQYNKQVAELRAKKQYAHIGVKGFKRYKQIQDLLHKASRLIVNYCLAHGLGKVVIGCNRGWKQGINLGRRNNQNFVSIPHSRFIDMIRYKAQEKGIEVVEREESYTSQASSLDFDPIPDYGKTKQPPIFSGKRVRRGLYRSASGRLINADINGAVNIGRKELGNEWFEKLLRLDGGALDAPIVIRRLHENTAIGSLLEMGVRPHETVLVRAR